MKIRSLSTLAAVALLLLAAPMMAQEAARISAIDNPPGTGGLGTLCECSAGSTILLDQPPNQVNGFFADATWPQTIADNFILGASETITELRVWGGYFSTDTNFDPDDFTVIFHEDTASLPGADADPPQTGLAATCKELTGVSLFGVSEYVYQLVLDTPVTLGPGTYWVELFNNTAGNPDVWFWETGDQDAVNGIFDGAFAVEIPGVAWNPSGGDNALQVCAGVPDDPTPLIEVPTLGQFGLMALLVSLLGAGIYRIRRNKV